MAASEIMAYRQSMVASAERPVAAAPQRRRLLEALIPEVPTRVSAYVCESVRSDDSEPAW